MAVNYKKLKNFLSKTKNIGPVFFVTPNPIYAIGLEKVIQNYFVICSQKADVINYFEKNKIAVLCLDDNKIKSSGKILLNKKVVEYIKKNSKNKKANIMSFKPSPMISKICEKNNFNYLGNNWKLSRDLEDKIKFIKVTEKLKIPNAESKAIKLDEDSFVLLRQSPLRRDSDGTEFKKNNKFVVQLPRGFSGNATFFIKDKNDFAEIFKKYKNREVKVSKYLKGETWTINACATKNEILISQPIFQITGFSSYNKNSFGGTCGNDYPYSQKLRKEEIKKIFSYTKKVGEYIRDLNYKGIFGLDFVVSNREDTKCPRRGHLVSGSSAVNLIEINPRIIGSMSLFTKLQIENKEMPFLLSHILEFVESREQACLFPTCDKSNIFNASQLILRNTESKPVEITKSLKSGIYEIKKNRLVFKEEAYYISGDLNKNEFLVQCSSVNRVVNPDIEYANIQVGYGVMKNEKEFKNCFEKIVKLVLKNIKYSILNI